MAPHTPRGLLGVVVGGVPAQPAHEGPGGARIGRGSCGQRLSGAGAGKIEPLFLGVVGSVGEPRRNNTNYSRGGAVAAVTSGQAGDPTGDPYASPPGSPCQIPAPWGCAAPPRPTGRRDTLGGAARPRRAVEKAP